MHVHGFKRFVFVWALPLLPLLPGALEGQLRTVVSNEIAVSSSEATLRLDFENRQALTISLSEGQVLVDQEAFGSYARGDALDLAWRSLLGDVISLDDGPLASALYEWMPPQELEDRGADVARRLDQALEEALALPDAHEDHAPAAEVTLTLSDESSLISALLSRTGALQGLARTYGQGWEQRSRGGQRLGWRFSAGGWVRASMGSRSGWRA